MILLEKTKENQEAAFQDLDSARWTIVLMVIGGGVVTIRRHLNVMIDGDHAMIWMVDHQDQWVQQILMIVGEEMNQYLINLLMHGAIEGEEEMMGPGVAEMDLEADMKMVPEMLVSVTGQEIVPEMVDGVMDREIVVFVIALGMNLEMAVGAMDPETVVFVMILGMDLEVVMIMDTGMVVSVKGKEMDTEAVTTMDRGTADGVMEQEMDQEMVDSVMDRGTDIGIEDSVMVPEMVPEIEMIMDYEDKTIDSKITRLIIGDQIVPPRQREKNLNNNLKKRRGRS